MAGDRFAGEAVHELLEAIHNLRTDRRKYSTDRREVRRAADALGSEQNCDGPGGACFKRPVPESELLRIADEVEDEIFKTHDREVQTMFVGELVADKLRRLDQVAYVRFASVYRQFKTLEELIDAGRGARRQAF